MLLFRKFECTYSPIRCFSQNKRATCEAFTQYMNLRHSALTPPLNPCPMCSQRTDLLHKHRRAAVARLPPGDLPVLMRHAPEHDPPAVLPHLLHRWHEAEVRHYLCHLQEGEMSGPCVLWLHPIDSWQVSAAAGLLGSKVSRVGVKGCRTNSSQIGVAIIPLCPVAFNQDPKRPVAIAPMLSLGQGWAISGPRATCGPPQRFKWSVETFRSIFKSKISSDLVLRLTCQRLASVSISRYAPPLNAAFQKWPPSKRYCPSLV